MRHNKPHKLWVILGLMLALVLPSTMVLASAPPGSLDDPLVTVQYVKQILQEKFTPVDDKVAAVDTQLAQIESQYNELLDTLGPYPDIRGHWAQQEVAYLAKLKIITGFQDGNFHPEDKVTRAQLAVMLVRAKGLAADAADSGFADVSKGYWAAKEIAAAKQAGIVSGYANNLFKPGKEVSRQEIAAMIARAFALNPAKGKVQFVDLNQAWAKDEIQQLADNGIIGGYAGGYFKPVNTATRAEIAAILGRTLDPSKRLKI